VIAQTALEASDTLTFEAYVEQFNHALKRPL